ncbi:hypothetical protein SASPL_110299 [Salvia splendens]|uniref:Fe2OG dioxygenase domain-containing protein n=1 Tax=Salvia splendens TaxID=180675 RepID=A0A8X8Y5W5_SALSN|nr:hypothetical protein SASPL_110299 [Salvia splendens]
MDSYEEPKIPIFEFTEASSTLGSSSWKSTSDSVRRALETYGCMVVSIEKTGPEQQHLQESLFSALDEVFSLPDETKRKYTSQLAGFGYDGRYPKIPHFEYFGIEDEGNFQRLKNFTTLMWPHGNDKFCSYGLEKHSDSSFYMIRLIKYNSPNSTESSTGLGPHKDQNFLNVLCSNEIEGLQVQNRHGEWMDFEPSPSKFIVLVGESLMAWSNGRLHSPTHRVITRGFKDRYSFGVFGFVHGLVEVPQELVDDQNPLRFKPFNSIDFLQYCKDGGPTIDHAIYSYCGI